MKAHHRGNEESSGETDVQLLSLSEKELPPTSSEFLEFIESHPRFSVINEKTIHTFRQEVGKLMKARQAHASVQVVKGQE